MPPDTTWQDAVRSVSPYVVEISTPEGSGTGFLIYRSAYEGVCGIATAAHVIDRAHEWRQPIRLRHHESGKSQFLLYDERSILIDGPSDTAIIVFGLGGDENAMLLPAKEPELWEKDKYLRVGNEVGWVGFPAVAPGNLCFFSGRVSCYLGETRAYLIDGVAINGVSGGPTFFASGNNPIIGVISAYVPNRTTGAALPGVAVVQDVFKLHEWVGNFRTLDDAKKAESPPHDPSSPGQ